MTAAQTTALENITEQMREHFEAAVFIFETDHENGDPTQWQLSYRTQGTFSQSLGPREIC